MTGPQRDEWRKKMSEANVNAGDVVDGKRTRQSVLKRVYDHAAGTLKVFPAGSDVETTEPLFVADTNALGDEIKARAMLMGIGNRLTNHITAKTEDVAGEIANVWDDLVNGSGKQKTGGSRISDLLQVGGNFNINGAGPDLDTARKIVQRAEDAGLRIDLDPRIQKELAKIKAKRSGQTTGDLDALFT